jgi:hypothetical protein
MTSQTIDYNNSVVTETVSARDGIPNTVYPVQLTLVDTSGGAKTAFSADVASGQEYVGAYQGTFPDVAAGGGDVQQILTINFDTAHSFRADTHYFETSIVSDTAETLDQTCGVLAAAFSTNGANITVGRRGGADEDMNLTPANFLIRVLKRSLAVPSS